MLNKLLYSTQISDKGFLEFDLYGNPKAIKNFLNIYETIKSSAIAEGKINILDICFDVNDAIKECGFNKQQMQRIDLWKLGYSETEISKIVNVSNVVIHNFLNVACKKISNQLTR